MKNIRIFYLKIFIFLVVKFSEYLNRRVFEMVNQNKTLTFRIKRQVKNVLPKNVESSVVAV